MDINEQAMLRLVSQALSLADSIFHTQLIRRVSKWTFNLEIETANVKCLIAYNPIRAVVIRVYLEKIRVGKSQSLDLW